MDLLGLATREEREIMLLPIVVSGLLTTVTGNGCGEIYSVYSIKLDTTAKFMKDGQLSKTSLLLYHEKAAPHYVP